MTINSDPDYLHWGYYLQSSHLPTPTESLSATMILSWLSFAHLYPHPHLRISSIFRVYLSPPLSLTMYFFSYLLWLLIKLTLLTLALLNFFHIYYLYHFSAFLSFKMSPLSSSALQGTEWQELYLISFYHTLLLFWCCPWNKSLIPTD